ncbi:hypothetical protein D3227_33655 [Mesorhizobium waimense]|uniref:Uncharacterized protein n=1 Tax=Mesorhizobium waimense TaxID=1300307 RepID=A0A3A5KCM5_9HYPH|nr:hypothetical protein [Mesorhizobium waimense]RJT28766.1 hypothetical protein D3227_33655 [Mesorhizobium waimense]
MHDTRVYVDQYESGPFGQRHVQVKSFDKLAEAESYVRSASIPLSAYLATDGWLASCLKTHSTSTWPKPGPGGAGRDS